jgi:hypothetical protein
MQETGIRNFTQETVLLCVNRAFTERTQMWAIAHGLQPLARKGRRSKILMADIDRLLAAMQEFIAAK